MVLFTRVLAHTLPALVVVLVGYWMGSGLTAYPVKDGVVTETETGGFSWTHGDARVFNWHPLLMSFGFVFCSIQAALVYISLPFSHAVNKVREERKNWLGLSVLILFGAHWLGSFVVFFYPGAEKDARASIAPYHVAIGMSILGLVVATVETGILEKLAFNGSCNVNGELNGKTVKGYMAPDCVIGNVIGLFVALTLAALVATIWTSKHNETPKTVGDEATPLLGSSGDEKTEMSV
uniref:Cytochrome b561 domain-containing protein n=1 Tax=Phytophthora ramorum TaxID=164328 RepID=H3GYT9_PHYRM